VPRRWARRHRSERAERPSSLAVLREPAFRRFMLSQVFNNLCLWTHRTAHVWLTVVVTASDPFGVGLVTALQFLPMMLSASGGGLGDRWSKRRVLLASQVVAVAGCLVLATVSLTGTVTLPLLCLLAVVLGSTAAIDAPVRLAFPREIVDQQVLKSAIGLNGIVFQSARVVGPAVAGLLIVHGGESVGFLVAAGCGVVALVFLATTSPRRTGTPEEGVVVPWRATLRAVRRDPALLSPLVGALLVGACLSNLQVALPLILDRIPSAGAGGFGLLIATIGLGGACGALTASAVRGGQGPRSLNLFLVVFALATLVVAAMPGVASMALVLFVCGLVMQLYNTNALTGLQEASPLGQHGRVMGLYVVAYFVWAGLGTPFFGLAAGAVGPRPMLAVSALVCAVAGGLLLAFWSPARERAAAPVGRRRLTSRTS